MVSLICKSCGATIPVDNKSTKVMCPYCENLYDVPMDEKREQYLNLYSRADDAWDHKDFEEAAELYQQILNIDNTQADAHFGIVLCKYGVTYEVDPVTRNKMPNCNRINRDSILSDKNYLNAIKYATREAGAVFTRQAKEIDRISAEFLRIVDKEAPYDVFISYKRTGEDGSVTIDSKVARKLYYHLRDKGFKVFFAEETLKSMAGEKFEPYIFAALSSAPVMVLIGSTRDHFEATWVKNEWRRYIALMNQGYKKTLIPAYYEMDPYRLPGELRSLQAMNANDFTFHEDITEIIRKKVADTRKNGGMKEVSGTSLEERYASKEKVDKLVELTDCERAFAVSVLVQCHGDLKQSQQYIQEDPDYRKNLWHCAECGKANTHDRCRGCGITKKESVDVARARKEMEERRRKNSEAYKKEKVEKLKKLIIPSIIVAAVVGLIFLLRWVAFLPQETVIGICAPIAFVAAIVILIVRRVSSGEGGLRFFIITYIVIALVLILIVFGARALFVRNVDDLHTPEIVQTYCYSTQKEDVILTITECSEDGQVKATWEFINDGKYGKVNLTGKIIEKKNNGDLKIEWANNAIEIMPSGVTWTDEKNASISKDWTELKTDTMTLYAGTNDEYTLDSAEDLQKLSGSDGTYFLKSDIDLSGVNWTPIEGFTGMLLGNGHTIKNLKIDVAASNVGFFSTLNGSVQNLKFENAQIHVSGYQKNVGIFCGMLNGNANGIVTSGSITAEGCNNVGGIAGYVHRDGDAAIMNLENQAHVTGADSVGGVFGEFYNEYGYASASTQFSNFTNSGAISGKTYIGGIFGNCTAKSTLTLSAFSNTGDVNGNQYVGGVAGYIYGLTDGENSYIQNSSCSAAICGEAYVGCIAGKAVGISINACTNTGSTLTATKYIVEDGEKHAYIGGFAGYAYAANNCTNEVTIHYTGGGAYVGGIAGYVLRDGNTTMDNLSNNANISGADYVGGIFGRFCNEYGYMSATTQFSGFDNSGTVSGETHTGGIIGSCIAKSMLTISDFNNTGDVTGTQYVGGISGYVLGLSNSDNSYIQNSACAANISGEAYVGCIAGKADGVMINFCSNTGSTLTATKYVTEDGEKRAYIGGFVGYGYGANDCTNEVSINYTAGGAYVGGVLGYVLRDGNVTMSNLENKSSISGADYTGGIIGKYYNRYGYSSASTQFSDFENSGTVVGKGYTGGIIGDCASRTMLYGIDLINTGSVSGTNYVGGIMGYCLGLKGSYIQDSSTTSGAPCGKTEGVTIN